MGITNSSEKHKRIMQSNEERKKIVFVPTPPKTGAVCKECAFNGIHFKGAGCTISPDCSTVPASLHIARFTKAKATVEAANAELANKLLKAANS